MERKTKILREKAFGHEAHFMMLKMISTSDLFLSWISLIAYEIVIHTEYVDFSKGFDNLHDILMRNVGCLIVRDHRVERPYQAS